MRDKEPTPIDRHEAEAIREETTVRDDLKTMLNELLWVSLPPSTTLARAEAIACEMARMIADEWGREVTR